MLPKRVCLLRPDGRLVPATAVRQAGPNWMWVPVPESLDGRLMGSWDNGRPLGTHPAVWYGWPRAQPDIRDEWTVSDGDEARVVRAYSAEHAVKVSGFDQAVVRSVLMKERWF